MDYSKIRNHISTTMKKILLMVVVAMMATVSANAQNEWKNEISIAYGGGSNTDLISSIYKGMFTGEQTKYWGPISFEYFHRVTRNNRLGIGAVVALGGCEWDDSSDAKTTFLSIMPAAKYNWVVKKSVSWYSKAAVGLTFASDSGATKNSAKTSDDSDVCFNFQASFIGVEIGGAFRVFGELGWGEQGIILAGLRYKF